RSHADSGPTFAPTTLGRAFPQDPSVPSRLFGGALMAPWSSLRLLEAPWGLPGGSLRAPWGLPGGSGCVSQVAAPIGALAFPKSAAPQREASHSPTAQQGELGPPNPLVSLVHHQKRPVSPLSDPSQPPAGAFSRLGGTDAFKIPA